jgi:two-component system C4-dicarboxylate transport sensor histidine kinase DctB
MCETFAPGGARAGNLASAIQRAHANVDRLLAIESSAQRKCRSNQDALLHAGKMASVGRMVAGINHEIKRPLASVRLLTECSLDLRARGDPARAAENLQRIERIVELATAMSARLEAFSRRVEPSIGPVSLRSVIADALGVLAPQLQSAQGRVEVRCDVPPVLADRDRLTFVLVNLVDNALTAVRGTPCKTVTIEAEQSCGKTVIRIRDRGPGLSAEVLEHLFAEFHTTKPLGQGLGLGLALAAEVMAEMGGAIEGGNHPEGGALFTLRLSAASDPIRNSLLGPPNKGPEYLS